MLKYGFHKIIGLLILSYILLKVDWRQMNLVILRSAPLYLLLAFLLNLPSLFIKSIRWKVLLARQGNRISTRDAFLFNLSALFLGIITPGRIGEMAKALYLTRHLETTMGDAFASTVTDRLLDLYLLFGLAMLGISLLNPFPWALYVGLGGLLILSIVFLDSLLKKNMVKTVVLFSGRTLMHPFSEKAKRDVQNLLQPFERLLQSNLFFPFVLTILGYSFFFFQCYLISKSFSMPLSYLKIVQIMALTNLFSFLPVTVAGLGTREAALLFLCSPQGIGMETVMAYSAGVFLVFYIGTASAGFFAWWSRPLSWRDAKNASI